MEQGRLDNWLQQGKHLRLTRDFNRKRESLDILDISSLFEDPQDTHLNDTSPTIRTFAPMSGVWAGLRKTTRPLTLEQIWRKRNKDKAISVRDKFKGKTNKSLITDTMKVFSTPITHRAPRCLPHLRDEGGK